MKEALKLTLILTLIICLTAAVIPGRKDAAAVGNGTADSAGGSGNTGISIPETMTIYCTSSGEIISMPLEEYTLWAVLAQIPQELPEEALKAQAVAARTYAVRRILAAKQSPDVSIGCAAISDDPGKYQTALSETQARAIFGSSFESIYNAVRQAASATEGVILTTDDGVPIIASFHTANSGMTESALDVWGSDIPYLVSVESTGDIFSEYSAAIRTFTAAEYKARVSALYSKADFSSGKLLELTKITPSGTVLEAKSGGVTLTGSDIAQLLTLNSACFTAEETENEIVFTVNGCGHLVGMSMTGAAYMAQNGSTWQEILAHYYPGTSLNLP